VVSLKTLDNADAVIDALPTIRQLLIPALYCRWAARNQQNAALGSSLTKLPAYFKASAGSTSNSAHTLRATISSSGVTPSAVIPDGGAHIVQVE